MKHPSPKQLSANQEQIASMLGPVKTIYTDVDGTMMGPGGCFFLSAQYDYTLEPARALLSAHRNDLDIVIVSGRNRLQLLENARLLGIRHYIAELGCQIVHELGKEVFFTAADLVDKHSGKSVFQIIAESGAVEMLFENFARRLEYHTPWSEQRECTHLFRGFIDIELANNILQDHGFSSLKVIDNGVIGRSGTLNGLHEIHAYHLLPKASGKVEAVQKDREIRSIPRSHTVAIGDAVSDLEIADQVGALFLVKNALTKDSGIEQQAERFDNVFITSEEMGLGFAQGIKFLIETGSASRSEEKRD